MLTIILFLAILSLLVVAHEFGHFIVARRCGMRVYEFGWGFPPRLGGLYRDPVTGKLVWVWGRGKSRLAQTVGGQERQAEFPATLYSINWLPLGGFVKIKGENGETANESDSFGHKSAWKKLLTVVAGVAMNFLLASVLLSIGLAVGLPADVNSLDDKMAQIVQAPNVLIQDVQAGSAAQSAGLKFGDIIVALNNKEVVHSRQVINGVRESAGAPLLLGIKRGKEIFTLTVSPAASRTGETPRLGVMLSDAGIVRYPWYVALYKGFVAAFGGLLTIFFSFYILIKQLMLGQGLAFDVSGPVGIAVVIGQSARLGFSYLLNVTAMISLSLAAINILPIPALDGGRALFIILEKLTGRKVPIKYEQLAHTVGFALLMLLIIVVTWRDVRGLL